MRQSLTLNPQNASRRRKRNQYEEIRERQSIKSAALTPKPAPPVTLFFLRGSTRQNLMQRKAFSYLNVIVRNLSPFLNRARVPFGLNLSFKPVPGRRYTSIAPRSDVQSFWKSASNGSRSSSYTSSRTSAATTPAPSIAPSSEPDDDPDFNYHYGGLNDQDEDAEASIQPQTKRAQYQVCSISITHFCYLCFS